MSDLIPEATYEAVGFQVDTEEWGLTYAQFGESKDARTPQVVVNFEILDEGEQKGRHIAWIGYFTEATTDRTIQSLRYCGFRGDDLAAAVTQKLDQKVQIVVEHDEYKGKVRARVAWVNRAGGGALKLAEPMGKEGLKVFAAKMKAQVRAVPEGGAPRPAASSGGNQQRGGSAPASTSRSGYGALQPEPPPPGDDDIPF